MDEDDEGFFEDEDDESNMTTFELEEQVWELEKDARISAGETEDDDIL